MWPIKTIVNVLNPFGKILAHFNRKPKAAFRAFLFVYLANRNTNARLLIDLIAKTNPAGNFVYLRATSASPKTSQTPQIAKSRGNKPWERRKEQIGSPCASQWFSFSGSLREAQRPVSGHPAPARPQRSTADGERAERGTHRATDGGGGGGGGGRRGENKRTASTGRCVSPDVSHGGVPRILRYAQRASATLLYKG